jgi:hypothetical protein
MTTLAAITTNAGRAKILNQDQQGLSVRITHLAVGSAGYTPVATQTALQAEQERVEIADSRETPAEDRLDLSAVVNSALEYWVREIGLYDEDGVLIFLWSAPQASLSLGYKSANVDFLLGLSLSLADLPAEAITVVDQGYDLELWIRPIEEDLAGEHPAGAQHNYAATNWRETSWLAEAIGWEAQAEMLRANGQSGIVNVRMYGEAGTEAFNRVIDGSYSTLNIHGHGNYRGMPGMAEIAACINGYYVRTRHNDYRIMRALPGAYLADEEIAPPAVPASVSAAGNASAQIAEMREYYRALAETDTAIRDYRPHFRWNLAVLEIWPELLADDRRLAETFSSFRHAEEELEMRAQMERILETAATGWKVRLENYSIIPGSIRQVNNNGKPALVLWRYRIRCEDVGSIGDYPRSQLLEQIDRPFYRWHYDREFNDATETVQARYRINAALSAAPADGRHTGPTLLDEIMGKVPGLDGGGSITEVHADGTAIKEGTTNPLNAAYYNRRYKYPADASNRTVALRGYNDPTLFVALTQHAEVALVSAGAYSYRASYAIPLELILRTPIEGWNPYALPHIADDAAVSGAGSEASPYSGYRHNTYYYLTPTEFFSGPPVANDPADTGTAGVWIADAGGTPRQVRAAGIYPQLPVIAGIEQRIGIRYPVYPLYHEGGSVYALVQAALGDVAVGALAHGNVMLALLERISAIEHRLRPTEHFAAALWRAHHSA